MTLARYLTAAIGARLADEGARVAIVLLALERTGRADLGGLLVAALMVPHVAAAPLAGAAADRVRRRKPLYAGAFTAYAVALAAAAVLIGRSTPAAAAALIVAGCLSPLLLGGLSSLLSELTPETLSRAFSLDATTYGLAGIAGPALAAVVAGIAGAAWSMVTLGVCVLVSALFFLTLPLAQRRRPPSAARHDPAPAARRPGHARRRLPSFGGLAVMVRRRRLGAMTVASALSQLGFGALPLAAAAVAVHTGRPALTGLIMSVTAAGGVLGSLLCLRIHAVHRHPERALLICTTVMAVPFALTAVLPADWLLFTLFALGGLFSSPVTVALFTVRDRDSPPDARTQVFTLGAGIKVTAAAAGAAIGGLMTAHGPTALLLAVGSCQLLAAATGAALLPRGKQHPPPQPQIAEPSAMSDEPGG